MREKRPGDLLLDRYFPDADEETRESARERFREFALLLVQIGERVNREQEFDSSMPSGEKEAA